MSALIAALVLLGLPALAIAAVALRIRVKERRRDAYLRAVGAELAAAGAERLPDGCYRWHGRVLKVEASTNPLFGAGFTARLAAWSDTIHDMELRRGRPVPEEFAGFAPLLARWESAGKMFLECYAAGVTLETRLAEDARALVALAARPLARSWSGGIFTRREGFERDLPSWHWRHDLRRRLPREARRWGVSYYLDGPLLNLPLARLFAELAGPARTFVLTDAEDLAFLGHAFGEGAAVRRGALVEVARPDAAAAADLHTDGEFFGALLAAKDVPRGFETPVPRHRFLEKVVEALPGVRLAVRRLYDEQAGWFSGEYEILSVHPLDVHGAIKRLAAELGAPVLDLEGRFHRRLVRPPAY
jgi:hypothetical protein